jgi:hypothetical protein
MNSDQDCWFTKFTAVAELTRSADGFFPLLPIDRTTEDDGFDFNYGLSLQPTPDARRGS